MSGGPEDMWEALGGFLAMADEEEEPTCALCGKPIRKGEQYRVREDGRAEHAKCPE